jgi:hypothetical protein
LVPPPDDDHDCGWKAYAKAQEAKLAEMGEKIAALERRFLEKKSEKRKGSKLPPPVPPTVDPVLSRNPSPPIVARFADKPQA